MILSLFLLSLFPSVSLGLVNGLKFSVWQPFLIPSLGISPAKKSIRVDIDIFCCQLVKVKGSLCECRARYQVPPRNLVGVVMEKLGKK